MFLSLRGVRFLFAVENITCLRGRSLIGLLTLAAVLSAESARADIVLSCGFEAAGDSWAYTSSSDLNCGVNTDPGGGDHPDNARIRGGSGSWFVNGTTAVLKFSEVLLSGWKDVMVNYHVSSTSTEYGGCRPDDSVAAYVAFGEYADQNKPSFGSTADITLSGRGAGARWEYDSGAPPVVEDAGWGGSIHPDGDGIRTVDGYSDFSIRVDDGYRSLALKLTIQNNRADDYWNIDDVTVEGLATVSRDCQWAGGDGLWNNDAENTPWASAAWDSAGGDNAVFAQSGATVTIPKTTVAVRSLSFEADGCFIRKDSKYSSARLALTNGGSGGPGANTVNVADAGHTATINVTIIANPGVGLTKTGAGTLVLSGTNMYTGPTVLNEGVVSVSAPINLGTSESAVVFDGGTLRFTKKVDLQSEHPFVFLDGGGTIDTQGYDCSATTTGWSGEGTLAKTGTGTLVLQGANDAFSGRVNVKQGTLRLENNGVLDGCLVLDIGGDAVLDVSAIAEGYRFGTSGTQILQGTGTVVGDLAIAELGVHDLGYSPGVQCVEGDYAMNGELEIEIFGSTLGDADYGYDQVRITGESHDASLGGSLSLEWSGDGWAMLGDRLWIVRNDTPGSLSGGFTDLSDGDLAGVYGGFEWRIYYGADADADLLTDGNDVLLTAVAPVPEPGTPVLLAIACLMFAAVCRRKKRACHTPGLC